MPNGIIGLFCLDPANGACQPQPEEKALLDMKHFLLAALVAFPVFTPESSFAQNRQASDSAAGRIEIVVDFVKVLELARPVSTLIIGSTNIVEAVMETERRAVLTGKTPGHTNLIALDSEGNPIVDLSVEVLASNAREVTVFEGKNRTSYRCGRSNCRLTESKARSSGTATSPMPAETPENAAPADVEPGS